MSGILSFFRPGRAGVQQVLEIAILAVVFYAVLRFLRSTRGGGLLRGLGLFLVVTFVAFSILSVYPGVPVLSEILRQVAPYIVLILFILFQPELRQGISRFGRGGFFGLLGQEKSSTDPINKVAAAAQRMAKERVGALIAFEGEVSLAPYRDSAVAIQAPVSGILLETIFYPGSPLHDGAVVIRDDLILAASCLLPLAQRDDDALGRLGTRHRAALGLSEETDAVVLVVSEETGQVSLCARGEIYRRIPLDRIEQRLDDLLRLQRTEPKAPESAFSEGTPAPVAPIEGEERA